MRRQQITRDLWWCYRCQITYVEDMGPESYGPVVHGISSDGSPVQSKRCACGRKLRRLTS